MLRVALSRLLQGLLTLLMTSVIVFVLARTSGSPVDLVLPSEATAAEDDRPISRGMASTGRCPSNTGSSWSTRSRATSAYPCAPGEPALNLVMARLGRTLGLATLGLLLALVVSVPIGVLSAVHRERSWDRIGQGLALLGQSVPSFLLGIVLILVFSIHLQWLPSSGIGSWKNYVLPAIVLGWSISAGIVRLLRSSMLEALGAEFVKLARSGEGTVGDDGCLEARPAQRLDPGAYLRGLHVRRHHRVGGRRRGGVRLAGPRLSRLRIDAWRDFPVLQCAVLVYTAIIVSINFLVDLGYGVADPRVRA